MASSDLRGPCNDTGGRVTKAPPHRPTDHFSGVHSPLTSEGGDGP